MAENERVRAGTRATIGAVTIGQSPRDDIVPELEAALGAGCRVVQAGALDGLSDAEIESLRPRMLGSHLVTRLRSGEEAHVRRGFAARRLAASVHALEDQCDLILLLCTGDFPMIEAKCPVLSPGPLLQEEIRGREVQCLGVLTPAAQQLRAQRRRWRDLAGRVVVKSASPYRPPELLEAAAQELRQSAPDVVVMDCVGYTREMRIRVARLLDRPVLSASQVLAARAREMVCEEKAVAGQA